ncbi:MAG: class I SAM-dependent methyltransferase [Deltaproteobacteria bacterium]|nr:class I SAM-dependent methyltransferase [Deltaproteobacteria bacterium]
MEEGRPSFTAIASAMLRAAHLLWDDPPKIFEDTFALQLSGCESEAALCAQLDLIDAEFARSMSPVSALTMRRSMTATVCMRSRYVEEKVDQAIGQGVSQYVILGAGLDSFAYRRSDVSTALRVFEVDHPATQAWKLNRLKEAGIDLPPNLILVAIDFEKQSLIDRLRMNGYRTDAPGLFSWLGVTVYLTHDAIFGTLRTIATLAAGTEIIFQFTVPKELVDEETQRFLAVVAAAGTARGEPYRSSFEPSGLVERVKKLGFADVSDFSPEEARLRYFTGRADGLRPLTSEHFMRARVGRHSD